MTGLLKPKSSEIGEKNRTIFRFVPRPWDFSSGVVAVLFFSKEGRVFGGGVELSIEESQKRKGCTSTIARVSTLHLGHDFVHRKTEDAPGGGCTQFVRGRSRMTVDPRIPTMRGWSTWGFHQTRHRGVGHFWERYFHPESYPLARVTPLSLCGVTKLLCVCFFSDLTPRHGMVSHAVQTIRASIIFRST